VSEARLRAAVAALALVGAGISAYLTVEHYAGATPVCATGGCETVLTSEYATLGSVPVALAGLVGYVLLALSALVRGEPGAAAGGAVTFAGLAFSAYLVYVQAALLDAFCVWCLASEGVMVALAALAVLRLRVALRGDAAAAADQ
jgi:uncharacterized membrane protein